ncbi:MAG: PspA-associated protein PspAB, partial [Nitrososphaeraceae archaeon]
MEFFSKIKKTLGILNNDNDKNNNNIDNPFIDSESIAALSLACIKLDENLGMKSTGKCGIFVKSVNSETFKQMKEHMDNFLKIVIDKKN